MAKKSQKRPRLSDQLREAIATCGLSRYRIAKETGLQASALSRFLSGERELSPQAVNAIGELLDLELVMHRPKPPTRETTDGKRSQRTRRAKTN